MNPDEPDNNTPAVKPDLPPILHQAAAKWGHNPDRVMDFLLKTVVRGSNRYKPTTTDAANVLTVAMAYNLNPFTREIHAFVDKDRIIPVVGVDGWMRIANRNGFNGADVTIQEDADGKPVSCTAKIHVKGRDHPVTITEYMEECYVPPRGGYSGPWQTHPRRMLRHKTLIQACRVAFSIGGIYDEDEADRIRLPDPIVVDAGDDEDPGPDPLLEELQDEPADDAEPDPIDALAELAAL